MTALEVLLRRVLLCLQEENKLLKRVIKEYRAQMGAGS